MASVLKTRGDVRLRLGFPNEDHPSDGHIDELMIAVADELITEQNQTNQDWTLLDATLTVNPGQATYNIEDIAPGFGKAHFVYTSEEGNSQFHARPVDLVDYLALVRDYNGGDPGPAGVKHSAIAFAFMYDQKQGRQVVNIGPIPQETADYKVIYEPDVVRPGSLAEQAFRHKQFDGYVADRIAFKAVHLCRWDDFDEIEDPVMRERANKAKRDDIRGTLVAEIMRGDDLFRRFKKSANQPNSFRRIAFGRRRR